MERYTNADTGKTTIRDVSGATTVRPDGTATFVGTGDNRLIFGPTSRANTGEGALVLTRGPVVVRHRQHRDRLHAERAPAERLRSPGRGLTRTDQRVLPAGVRLGGRTPPTTIGAAARDRRAQARGLPPSATVQPRDNPHRRTPSVVSDSRSPAC